MEGERILKDLLKKNLDGLYDDTKNYIATLTRVLEPEAKNGYKYKANGCNTVEQIVTKYSQFCNKFLRCAIEILKGAKDGKDLKEIMKIVNMVMNVLDLVLTYNGGKYQSIAPTLDDVGKKLYHITSQLITKGAFEMSLNYVEYCIKYIQLAKTTENSCIKELKNVAKSMGSLCWRAAVLVEQSSKGTTRYLACLNALRWRLCGVLMDAEAGSESISCVVTKALKSTMKFQMDCGSNLADFDTNLLYYFDLIFDTLKTQLRQQTSKPEQVFGLCEFGLHFARLFHSIKKPEDAISVFEKLESFTSETLKSIKANTSESCLISRFSTCNIAVTKAAMVIDELLQRNAVKTNSFAKLDKLLDDGYRALELLTSDKGVIVHPATIQTLEHLKCTVQSLTGKDKLLPSRTFYHVQLILARYANILITEMAILDAQHKQQHHKTVAKYLSLSSMIMKVYLQQIQVNLKQKVSQERKQLMFNCLQYSQQCSDTIKSLITNPEVCSPDELMWHGSITFTIGKEAYRHDIFDRGSEFMLLGCNDMKQWCHLSDLDMLNTRLQQLQLLPKYEALRDCQRRAKYYKEAFDSTTAIIELFLYSTQEVELETVETDLQKYLQLWVQSKHEAMKHCCQKDDLSMIQQRTLLDVVDDNRQTLSISSEEISYVLQQAITCCKVLSTRYDTSLEQLSTTTQLINLFREDNSFHLPVALLEHMKILHSLGSTGHNNKTPLDYCQEAIDLLEALKTDCQQEDDIVPMITVQDTLATAYLWKGILQHEEIMAKHGHQEVVQEEETKKSNDQVIGLEQPFVLSLHAAVDVWTSMVENCLKESKDNKIDLSDISDPVETVNSLKTVGLLYGILNQPLNQVHSNHLCAVISQALDTPDGNCDAIDVYCQAIHTLCNTHDLHHAQLIMLYCKKIENATSLRSSSLVHLLLAKSHLHLELGQFAQGEECLSAAIESDFMTGKTSCDQVTMQSMFYSLLAKYLQLPPSLYTCQLPHGNGMTALDAAVESVTKLESIVDKLFSRKLSDASSTPVIASDKSTLWMVHNLLVCQLQCGCILSHQGMVKQAVKYFTDGLVLSRRIVLPYRVAEFINFLSIVKIQKGDYTAAKDHLMHVCHVIGPIIQPDGDVTTLENCLQAPPLVNHKDTCRCICCTDPTVQSLQIAFFITFSKYLETMQQHRQSITALGITDDLISHATQRLQCTLEEFTSLLRLGSGGPDEDSLKSGKAVSKKKGRAKSSKAKQSKKPVTHDNEVSLLSTTQMMFSVYLSQVFVQNADILLENSKLNKALEVVNGGNDVVQTVQKVTGSLPFWLIPITTHLLYLEGLVYVLQALQNSKTSLDSTWGIHCEQDDNKTDNTSQETVTVTTKAKKRSARGRTAKTKDASVIDDDSIMKEVEKTVKKKGRGRSKKADVTQAKQSQQDDKECSPQSAGKECLQLAIETFNKALDLSSRWPNPKVYSQLCQCLALCYGQSEPNKTAHYLDVSLGITLRYEAAYSTRKKIRKLLKANKSEVSCDDVSSLSNKLNSMAIDDSPGEHQSVIQSLQDTRNLMTFQQNTELDTVNIPRDWTICTLIPIQLPGSSCQLVISRQRPGKRPVLVKVFLSETDHDDDLDLSNPVNKAVMDLSQLFQGDIKQEFADIMQSSSESMSINDSKDWHHARSNLDSRLKCLLERMENSWLGMWKGLVLGQHCDRQQQQALIQATKDLSTKLAQYNNKTVDEDLLEILVDSHDFLTIQQVREAMSSITGIDKKSSILDQILEEFKEVTSSLTTRDSGKKKGQTSSDRHPVILILGKDIQHLPWESIPILRQFPITRMPCMHLVLAQTQKGESNVVDPVNTYFVLNPEGNLPNTQKIFQKWFESELKWQGVTGHKPSEDQYKTALSDHDLFLYLGHGTGQSFLRGDDVQRIICRATTLLMGCSSAKLMVGGICEPRGMSLSYLVAGCPAIVGNLWDVTDRDIDRFTKSLLQAWLQNGQKLSLPQFIRNARQVCKWPYLIGASPVLYGVPVFLKNSS